jgi:nicotinate-nucleotide pyrophosphorylase (carboxylating)
MTADSSVRQLITLALEEDIGTGDLSALAVPPDIRARARLVTKEPCVLSGLEVADLVLEVFGADAKAVRPMGSVDGAYVTAGTVILEFEGRARDLLTCERTFLNIMQRLCGVATQARRFHEVVKGLPIRVLDTRKTTPGLRIWEKKAVRDGGLHNHRMRLDEAVLVKENHIRASGSIQVALANLAGKVKPEIPVEVEVSSWAEAKEALDCGVTRLLLDNFSPVALAEVVKQVRAYRNDIYLEASGGVTLETLRSFAETGVDAVSVGALTHSVRAVDLSLLFDFS